MVNPKNKYSGNLNLTLIITKEDFICNNGLLTKGIPIIESEDKGFPPFKYDLKVFEQ